MNNSTSLIQFEKNAMRGAVAKTLSFISDRRHHLWEEQVKRVMTSMRIREGWFTYRRYTREEAEAHLKKDGGYGSTYFYIFHLTLGNQYETAMRINRAMNNGAKQIFLSLDDAAALGLA